MRHIILLLCLGFFIIEGRALHAQVLAQAEAPATPPAQAGNLDRIILRADNFILLRSELDVSVLQAQAQAKDKDPAKLQCQVLEQLVLQKMMLAKSEIDSTTVKDDEVDAELDERMAYMIQTVGSREKLEAYYKKSVEQFKAELKKQVKEQLVARKVQGKITEDVKVTPSQVRRYFNAIPKDSIPFFPAEVEVGQVVRLFKPGRQRRLEARTKAEDLRAKIVKGEDFEIMARIYSQDPGSAPQGGKIVGAQRGQMVPEFEAAAMTLKKGETSPVTESQFGFHIIQVLDKRGNEYDARHILIQATPSDDDRLQAFASLDSLAKAIRQDSIKFDRAALKYTDDPATKNSSGYFLDPATASPRISTEALDPKVFFTIDTMKLGQVSKPISFQSEDGKLGYRILYYKAKYPPHEANLRTDYQRIQAGALQEAKRKTMQAWIKRARTEVSITLDPEYTGCKVFSDNL